MKHLLAWKNLAHNKRRTLVALAGVAFAVILVFMELGFLGSVRTTATLIYDTLDFDLVIRSRSYLHFADARHFPKDRLLQVQSQPGVAWARPLYTEANPWRNPKTGRIRGILLIGVDPYQPVFNRADIAEQMASLNTPEAVLVDRKSRAEFGPQNGSRFSDADVGIETELAGQTVRIAGSFTLGTGLANDGAALMSDRGFARVSVARSEREISLGLVKLKPGANLREVARSLKAALLEDVEVFTRAEVLNFELNRWINETSIGLIFQLGVLVSLLVGTAIVFQVLSTDVARQLPEYATLKAMGYNDNYLSSVVLQQALLLAVGGFIPGWLISQALYEWLGNMAGIPIWMPTTRIFIVLGLTVLMCAISGLLALRKLRQAEPAELFK